jgi:hypothetical protein
MAPVDRFDEFLCGVSVRGVWMTRVADSYAVRFYRAATLRKKLILVLALIESSDPGLDQAPKGSVPAQYVRLALAGLKFAAAFLVSLLVLPVIHLFCGRTQQTPQA